jgi:RND superfamily putative drug exporter
MVIGWVVALAGAGGLLAPRAAAVLQPGGFYVPDSESTAAATVLDQAFNGANRNNISVVFNFPNAVVDDPSVTHRLTQADTLLSGVPGVRHVDSYIQTGTPILVSADRHTAISVVTLDGSEKDIEARVPDLRAALQPISLEHYVTGQPASNADVREVSESDLRHAESITLPIVAILLLLVFRTVVATTLPLVLGGASVTLALALMYLLSSTTDISIFALNTASMIGLGLGIDFSLIVVNRFDEELDNGRTPHDAVVATLASAGRSIAFSGVTVFAGMLLLTLFIDLLVVRSMSLAVMLVAGTGVLAGLTLLPALLAILGARIHWLRVLPKPPRIRDGHGTWYRLSQRVMRDPWAWLLGALSILAILTLPVLDLRLMGVDPEGLPANVESTRGMQVAAGAFGANRLEPIQIVMSTAQPDGAFTPAFLTGLQKLSDTIAGDPRVDGVLSLSTAARSAGVPDNLFPSLTPDLLRADPSRAAQAADLINLDHGGTDAAITVYVRSSAFDDDHQALVHDLRERIVPSIPELRPYRVLVGGLSAGVEDYSAALYSVFPFLIAAVLGLTFVILTFLFRSLVLPIKAILLNAIGILATYGTLVLIFEDGWGANLIGLNPQGKVFVITPALLFVILFGLSTDYEVFMLSRIGERFRATGDNAESVSSGLDHSARVITAAGLVLVGTFASFGTSQIIFLKELGVGLAIGVLIDTTLIRLILVPASMRLMGRANWWMPRAFRSRRWLAAAGVAAGSLLLGACSPRAVAPTGGTPASPRATNVSAVTVERGDIQQTLNLSGDLRATEQVNVSPKASGRLEQVLVDTGASVKAGDVIAQLDQDGPQVQLQQAQAALAAANAKLAQLESGARPEDVAAAQAALTQQQIKLQNMQDGGRVEDVRLAQAGVDAQQAKLDLMLRGGRAEAVAQAQAALDAANAKFTSIQKGATDDVRQAAQSAVQADQAALSSAQAAYSALGGSNAADLQSAQAAVASLQSQVQAAESAVDATNAALNNLKGTAPADIQQAQSALDSATAQRNADRAALDGAASPTIASVTQAQAAVDQANALRQQAEAQQTALEKNATPPCAPVFLPTGARVNANTTACGAAKSAADAAVQAGDAGVDAAQAQLDLLQRGGPPSQQAQLQAALKTADAQVRAADARLKALVSGGIDAQRAQLLSQQQQAQSQLVAVQNNLQTAQAKLAAITSGVQDAQIKQGQAQVTAASERLKADQARLQQILDGPTDEDLQQAQAAVDQATQQLALAQSPATDEDIRAQRAALQQAQLQLQKAQRPYTSYDLGQQAQAVAQAQAVLDKASNPYTDQDLAAAQAAVDQANAQMAQASLVLKETTVVAPVGGRVQDRLQAAGALVSPSTPIVTLVPPQVELAVSADETQFGRLTDGQAVQISAAAFADRTFSGTVKSVPPSVDPKTRTAEIRIQPSDPEGLLRAGMSATASIVTAAHHDALVVPRSAVSTAAPALLILDATNHVHLTPVQIGIQTAATVEITGGVSDGQVVATSNVTDLRDGDLVMPQLRGTTTALAATGD